MTELLLAAAAAVGAPARYAADTVLARRTGGRWPVGTLAVNVAGALVLGVLSGLALHHGLSGRAKSVWGSGFCGALTTYSTFSYEAVRLAQERRLLAATAYVSLTLALGLLAAAAGLGLALL